MKKTTGIVAVGVLLVILTGSVLADTPEGKEAPEVILYEQEWLNNLSPSDVDTAAGVYTELGEDVRIWIPDDWYLTGEMKTIDDNVSANSEETGESGWQLYNSDFTYKLTIKKQDVMDILLNSDVAEDMMTEEILFTDLEKDAVEARRIQVDGQEALLMTKKGYSDVCDTYIVWVSENKTVYSVILPGDKKYAAYRELFSFLEEGDEVIKEDIQKLLNSFDLGLTERKEVLFQEKLKNILNSIEIQELPDQGSEEPVGDPVISDREKELTALTVTSLSFGPVSGGMSIFYDNGQIKDTYTSLMYFGSGSVVQTQFDEYGNPLMVTNTVKENGTENVTIHQGWEYEYDENGRILISKETNYLTDEEEILTYDYEFDKAGNPVCRTAYNGEELKEILNIEYDENGRRIREVTENQDGTVLSGKEYAYDEQGRQVKSAVYDPEALKAGESRILVYSIYDYDSQGRLKAEHTYNSQSEYFSSEFYVYDAEES